MKSFVNALAWVVRRAPWAVIIITLVVALAVLGAQDTLPGPDEVDTDGDTYCDDINPEVAKNFERNVFSVTRQLYYSQANPNLSIDMALHQMTPKTVAQLKCSLEIDLNACS